jgi:DNA repair protein RadC
MPIADIYPAPPASVTPFDDDDDDDGVELPLAEPPAPHRHAPVPGQAALRQRWDKGPRERLLREGLTALNDAELLALMFGTGSRGAPAVQLAERLLVARGLNGLAATDPVDLCVERGIGPARSAQVAACFELGRRVYGRDEGAVLIKGPEDVYAATSDLRGARKEHFVTFHLNARNQVIARETVSIGSLNASIVHPREVYEPAVRNSAASIILVHNHPSGETDPSDDDLALTRRLVQVGDLLGIAIVDHFIVGRRGFTSFKQQGYI